MPSEPDCPELAAFCPTSGATSAPSPGGNSLDTAACRQAGGSFRFLLWRDDASICDAARKLDCGRRRLVGERTLRLEKKGAGQVAQLLPGKREFRECFFYFDIATRSAALTGPMANVSVCEATKVRNSRPDAKPVFRPCFREASSTSRLLFAQVGTDHQVVPAVTVGMRIDPTLSVPRRGQGSRLAPGRPAMPTGRGERLVSKTEATCAKIATRK